MSRSITRWIGVALVVLALALPAQAQNVLTIRVENFDSLIDDVDKIAVALGQPRGSADNWLAMAQELMGMPDFDWVDRKNPVVLALPLEGLMLGQNGFVGALPVADIDAAVAAMKSAVEGVEIDENGLIHLPTGAETETLFRPANGYLIFGRNPSLVGGFEPAAMLSGAHLPPGTIAVEFNVDSMRAMIGMAIQGARQQVAAGIIEGAGEGGGEIAQEAATAVADTMVGWIQSLVANTRSVQLALEVTDSHMIVHNHYLPVGGSTLESFLHAQEGGMPDVARLLDDSDSAMTMVGNINWTDESIAVLEGFMAGYGSLLETTLAGNEDLAALGLGEFLPTMMDQYAGIMKCMRGDMAQVLDMSEGLRFSQVSGIRDAEECRDLNQQVLDVAASLPEAFSELFSFDADGLKHRGVAALSYGFDLRTFLNMPNDEEFNEMMSLIEGLFGEGGFTAYMAQAGDYWVATGGAGADESLRGLIDRVKDKKSAGGIDASTFAPFDVGSGLYVMFDFGRMVGAISKVLPDGAAEQDDMAEVQELLDALGAITGGLDLRHDALALKFAMSTSGLTSIAEMVQRENAAAAEAGKPEDGGSGGDRDED